MQKLYCYVDETGQDTSTKCGGLRFTIERGSLIPQRSYGVQGGRSLSRVDA